MQRSFAAYHLKETLSDCVLLVSVDGNVKQRLPGHGVVLSNVSTAFKRAIESAADTGPRTKPIISLEVQGDQVAAACALVRFIYTGELPDDAADQEVLHMLHLAGLYGVVDCQRACRAALLANPRLSSAALGLAFSLLAAPAASSNGAPPTAAAAAADATRLLEHCQDQLQQQLGNLELVMREPRLLSALHSLPLPALLALLHDERTSAASENTVAAAVHSWMNEAVQRDVRVDAEQRHALAAAVRVPLLEPCFLATVLPRMGWLVEVLGPQGLAMAAGAARGLCDPHAEPILSNARACGPLAAAWLKGPRPVPDSSCDRAMHGGPQLRLDWTLPLEDVEAAFAAACAAAVAKAEREAATAAASARQAGAASVTADAPGWVAAGTSSAAAAVSAVAAVAAAAAARVFTHAHGTKRKRSPAVSDHTAAGRDQQSSSTGREPSEVPSMLHELQPYSPAAAAAPRVAPAAEDEAAAELQQSARKRRRHAGADGVTTAGAAAAVPKSPAPLATRVPPSPGAHAAAAVGLGQGVSPAAPVCSSLTSDEHHSGPQQQGVMCSPEATFAGYTWRLVLYFQPSVSSAAAAAPRPAACTSDAQDVAAAAAVRLPDGPADPAARLSCAWTARLAIEAWPCVKLSPGVSTAAFSGSLAARMRASAGNSKPAGAVGSSRPKPSPARGRQLTAAAAAAGASPAGQHRGRSRSRSGSQGDTRHVVYHDAAAAGLGSIPEMDDDELNTQLPTQPWGAGAHHQQRRGTQATSGHEAGSDADDEEDGYVTLVGKVAGCAHAAIAAAAAGRRGGSSRAGRRAAVIADSDDEEGDAASEDGGAPRPDGSNTQLQRLCQLPQGTWVKSRGCDTGFRNFFSLTLQHGHWDASSWAPFLQPGGVLKLQGRIWNVR